VNRRSSPDTLELTLRIAFFFTRLHCSTATASATASPRTPSVYTLWESRSATSLCALGSGRRPWFAAQGLAPAGLAWIRGCVRTTVLDLGRLTQQASGWGLETDLLGRASRVYPVAPLTAVSSASPSPTPWPQLSIPRPHLALICCGPLKPTSVTASQTSRSRVIHRLSQAI